MFGVLLDGIHDVVVGRVADAAELAVYLERFCTREEWPDCDRDVPARTGTARPRLHDHLRR